MKRYIIALDQGTTSSRAIIFDNNQTPIHISQREYTQYFPNPGWVEHNPMEIYSSQYSVMTEAIAASGIDIDDIAAIGITNQRETTVVWDRKTGEPIYNAIVWQCRRTSDICDRIKEEGYSSLIQDKTGLLIDAYFSATKIAWILDNVNGAREKAQKGELAFGTVDSWLVYKLTNGKVHKTDYTNASRTMLFDIHKLCWDEELCKIFNIPMNMLPEVCPSSSIFGEVNINGHMVPISGIAGDQQSALFAQGCFNVGEAKNTYGTGCFILMNTGSKAYKSGNGLVTTVAASGGKKPDYAIEGSVFIAGSIVKWIRDELGFIRDSKDSEYFAQKVDDSAGVYVVPAFTGLGAPYWDMYARGAIFGLTRGTNRNHIIRAALESIAYQSLDVIEAMYKDTGISLTSLAVDGGASNNNFLMQFQSDILGIDVLRPKVTETTALGAAFLAGLGVGVWDNPNEIKKSWVLDRKFTSYIDPITRGKLIGGWKECVKKVMTK